MPEHLKNLFDRALDDEPVPPAGDFAQQAMAAGRGIRRRRRGLLVGGSTAAAVIAVVAALNLTAEPVRPPVQMPVAAAWMAQAEPQCTWWVSHDVTDVSIFLRQDITEQQRNALTNALRADPLVRDPLFENRQQAYMKFKELWNDSPDLVAAVKPEQMPESFRLKLTRTTQYSGFAATYAGRAGVQDVIGGTCP